MIPGSSWLRRGFWVLDLETTGTDPETARIVQICLGLFQQGQWAPRTRLVNPGIPIPAEATAIHGITDEMVKDSQTAFDTLAQMIHVANYFATGLPTVIHNAPYDLTVVDRELRRVNPDENLDPPLWPIIDTLTLWRRFSRRTGSRSLTSLADRHGITFPAHDAEADAHATAQLLIILATEIDDAVALIEPEELHKAQAGWYATQQEQIVAKALGEGRDIPLRTDWPLIPYEGGAL